jgi:TonB-linked SusC/RagA family outer membrane protein
VKAQQSTEENETESNSTVTNSDGLVQVAFRKTLESDLLGGVSVVNMPALLDKNYTTYSLDNMQGLVPGWTGSSLWGMDDYLVLIDGVPRDANNVMPTEIQQITFLKGAAAVTLYGSRAAKGVVYISTKRGTVEPLKVNVRANTGYYVSKSYPKYLGSAEYMTLYNEALTNDGGTPLYSEEDIYHTASGVNPYRYPDVDFYSSEYLKKAYNLTDFTAQLKGGNERSRFYTNIGYYRQGDVFNFGEAKNNYIDRLNVRGNVDLDISEMISAFVNANATFYNASSARSTGVINPDQPNERATNYWDEASSWRPNRVAPLIPLSYIDPNDLASLEKVGGSSNIIDGKYFLSGSQADPRNIFADYYAAGNSRWTSRQFQFDAGLNFNLSRVLKGLSFHTQYAVDYATSYTTSYENSYAVFGKPVDQSISDIWFNYNGNDVLANLQKYNNDQKSGDQIISGSSNRQTIAFSGYLNYVTSLNEAHNFSARLLAAGFQRTQSQVYHRIGNANLGLEMNYNYKNRYYADLGAALIHSAKLGKGNRSGLSPSITLGWKLNKEGFLENSSVIDDLVVSVSGSILQTDLDIDEFNLSETNYTQASGAWWGWRDGASERSTNSLRGTNKDLTFVKRKEISANVRASLWDRLITAQASFFVNSMEGLPIQPSTLYPSYFSTDYPDASFMPYVNFNNNQRRGIDLSINLNKQIGEVGLSLGLMGTYFTTEATRVDENFADDYRNRTGQPLDGIWGLKSAGLFQDQFEIDNSPRQKFGGQIRPGDIKYVDQNSDGLIDEKDEVFLGRGGWYGSPLAAGVNITAKWKGFTLFVLGTGDFGAYGMKDDPYFWVYGDGKYSEVVRDRWTETTKQTATYPRLTTESGINNFRNSDFWLYKTNRFNLARVQLTYELPKSLFQTSFFQDVSVYVSGANLLMLSKEREILEMNTTSAPQTRFYNIGVRAAF